MRLHLLCWVFCLLSAIPLTSYAERQKGDKFLFGDRISKATGGAPNHVMKIWHRSMYSAFPEDAKSMKAKKYKKRIPRGLDKKYRLTEIIRNGNENGKFTECTFIYDARSNRNLEPAPEVQQKTMLVYTGTWDWTPDKLKEIAPNHPLLYMIQRKPAKRWRRTECPRAANVAYNYIEFQAEHPDINYDQDIEDKKRQKEKKEAADQYAKKVEKARSKQERGLRLVGLSVGDGSKAQWLKNLENTLGIELDVSEPHTDVFKEIKGFKIKGRIKSDSLLGIWFQKQHKHDLAQTRYWVLELKNDPYQDLKKLSDSTPFIEKNGQWVPLTIGVRGRTQDWLQKFDVLVKIGDTNVDLSSSDVKNQIALLGAPIDKLTSNQIPRKNRYNRELFYELFFKEQINETNFKPNERKLDFDNPKRSLRSAWQILGLLHAYNMILVKQCREYVPGGTDLYRISKTAWTENQYGAQTGPKTSVKLELDIPKAYHPYYDLIFKDDRTTLSDMRTFESTQDDLGLVDIFSEIFTTKGCDRKIIDAANSRFFELINREKAN